MMEVVDITPSISHFAGYFTVLELGTVSFDTLIVGDNYKNGDFSGGVKMAFLHPSTLPLIVVDSEIKISLS